MAGRKSERLRLSEVRGIFRLVGECCDLGADPAAWRIHVACRIGDLTGSQVCVAGEAARSLSDGTPGQVFHVEDRGWGSPRAREIFTSYMARGGYFHEPMFRSMQVRANRHGVCSRDQVVDNSKWLNSKFYNETLRHCEQDEFLICFQDLPGRMRQNVISLLRPARSDVFGRRERRLLRLFHAELGRHFGAALATGDDPSPAGLVPRLRATLRCLLEGDSEKMVAARLGLSSLTVHGYVKEIYRHFRVSSRAELMAYFLRRSGFRLPTSTDPD